jgi:hypothetical protein
VFYIEVCRIEWSRNFKQSRTFASEIAFDALCTPAVSSGVAERPDRRCFF